MRNVLSKREIVISFQNSRTKLLSLVEEIPEEVSAKPRFDKNWSIKDVFAHLCYWDWWKISAIDQILAGILPPYFDDADDEEVNEREVRMRTKRTWQEVLDEFRRASLAFTKKLESTDDESFSKRTGLAWNGEDVTISWLLSYVHYDEHIAQIESLKNSL